MCMYAFTITRDLISRWRTEACMCMYACIITRDHVYGCGTEIHMCMYQGIHVSSHVTSSLDEGWRHVCVCMHASLLTAVRTGARLTCRFFFRVEYRCSGELCWRQSWRGCLHQRVMSGSRWGLEVAAFERIGGAVSHTWCGCWKLVVAWAMSKVVVYVGGCGEGG